MASTSGTSRLSGYRAAFRLARRDAWRNRGRSALIAVMVALPVLAASTSAVLFRSDQRDPRDIVQVALGNESQGQILYIAQTRIEQKVDGGSFSGSEEPSLPNPQTEPGIRALLQARISARDRLIPDFTWYTDRAARLGGRRLGLEVRELDYRATGLGGLIEQLSGRSPAAADEVVISRALAHRENIHVGDTLSFTPVSTSAPRQLRVVGMVGGANLIGNSVIIGQPGALIPAEMIGYRNQGDGPGNVSWQVVGPDPVPWAMVRSLNAVGGSVISRAAILNLSPGTPSRGGVRMSAAVGIGVVVIGLVLLQIALLAGPAIAVGARRNQHGLAVMASTGAEPRHLRAVVLAGSGVIGLVSGIAAAVLGAGLGAVIALVMMRYDNRAIVRVDVHVLDQLGLALVGGLTAVAAALLPARQAARLDVVAVLTGRRTQLPIRARIPLLGLLTLALGVLLAYLFSGRHSPFPTVAALAMAELGLIAATGTIVMIAARSATRLPFALRFALRDAARQRSRTVPAVAAVLAAVAGGTCALVFVAAQSRHDRLAFTPAAPLGTVLVQLDGDASPDLMSRTKSAVEKELPVSSLATYGQVRRPGDGSFTALETEGPPLTCPADGSSSDRRCKGIGWSENTYGGISDVFDDGSAYPLLTGEDDATAREALRSGRVAVSDPSLLWPDGTVHVTVVEDAMDESSDHRVVALPATLSSVPSHLYGPVYPLSAAKALGVQISMQGLVATTTRMPTSDEESRASRAVQDISPSQVTLSRGYQDNFAIGLIALVVAAGVVTLAGTFTAVGLATAESRADVATLAAVGASPAIRRRLAASQAGVISGFGSLLGALSGVLAGWALVRIHLPMASSSTMYGIGGPIWGSDTDQWRMVMPWAHLLVVAVGIPLLAAGLGFLTTRSRLPLVRRIGQ